MLTLYAATMAAHAQGLRYEARIEGPAFPTEVTLPLLAVEAEMLNSSEITSASTGASGRPVAGPVVLRRTPDAFSASFAGPLASDDPYSVRVLAIGTAVQGGEVVLFELALQGAKFTGHRAQFAAEGAPIESVSLLPGCFEVTSNTYDAAGVLVDTRSHAYSYTTNQAGCP